MTCEKHIKEYQFSFQVIEKRYLQVESITDAEIENNEETTQLSCKLD